MRVLRIYWVGTRTDHHDATVACFRDVLGLSVRSSQPDFTVLSLPDGSTVEVFGPSSTYNRHFDVPVVGFLVSDLAQAEQELHRAGLQVVLAPQRGETGGWLHFRAPDGFLYELSQEW